MQRITGTNFAIRHTMTNSCSSSSTATHYTTPGRYTRHTRTSCSSAQHHVYSGSGPGTLLWSRTRCLRNKTRKTVIRVTTHSAAGAAAPAAPCIMYVKLTSRLLRRHFDHHRWSYIFLHWNKKNNVTKKKTSTGLESQTPSAMGQHPICSPTFSYIMIFQIDVFLYIGHLGKIDEKTKKAPAAGWRREHGLGWYL